jgi:hypothetical protein
MRADPKDIAAAKPGSTAKGLPIQHSPRRATEIDDMGITALEFHRSMHACDLGVLECHVTGTETPDLDQVLIERVGSDEFVVAEDANVEGMVSHFRVSWCGQNCPVVGPFRRRPTLLPESRPGAKPVHIQRQGPRIEVPPRIDFFVLGGLPVGPGMSAKHFRVVEHDRKGLIHPGERRIVALDEYTDAVRVDPNFGGELGQRIERRR